MITAGSVSDVCIILPHELEWKDNTIKQQTLQWHLKMAAGSL